MLSVKSNFVVERNVLLQHQGPTYAPSYPLLKEDKDEMRRVKAKLLQKQKQECGHKEAMQKKKKASMDEEEEVEEKEVRPVLVDELCHVCASCEKVTERDFKSRDGSKTYCSFWCKLKDERPQMDRGVRQGTMQAPHMRK